ncbi:MAG: MFS transporter [Bacilli bacterium]|nr:MFS transporter [Bacilli bacterium]
MAENVKKSFFETRLMRSKIKSQTVSLFPEAGLGYLLGPILALFCNGVVNVWLVQYWHNVIGMGSWGKWLETVIPLVSSVIIIVGNLLVGRLMERKPSLAGKARPLILIGMPFIAVALVLLFVIPVPGAADEKTILEGLITGQVSMEGGVLASIFAFVGYNLFYAFAWPLYYTSHSALVNLSTRDSGKRGLLGTAIMAAQLAAAGVSGMFGGIIIDALGLLPVYTYDNQYAFDHNLLSAADIQDVIDGKKTLIPGLENSVKSAFTNDFTEVDHLVKDIDYKIDISRFDANQKWVILMIVMIVALIIGCLLEYFFTRERITEETIKNAENTNNEEKAAPKKVTMGQQIKICVKDKFWWMIMIFWFLYQFGGMMKNNDMSFYSQAYTNGVSVSSWINMIGAVPTALGMVIVWPLAAKFTKAKAISLGGVLAALGASAAFSCLAFANNTDAVTAVSIASFCVKAIGTAPAMYISIALMANVLDHQEAVHGVRTDGFTMAVYGSIMVAMSGICNGIIMLFKNIVPLEGQQFLHTFLAYGVEGVCYLIIAVMFLFMNVEKFTNIDNKAIVADQKAEVIAAGGNWVEPEIRAKQEEEENTRLVEEARIEQLKIDCEKKGLNFEEENAKFLAKKAEADAKAEQKKADADAKKQAKLDAMSEEQKAAMAQKEAEKKAKQEENDAQALEELNRIREANNRPAVVLD